MKFKIKEVRPWLFCKKTKKWSKCHFKHCSSFDETLSHWDSWLNFEKNYWEKKNTTFYWGGALDFTVKRQNV